MRKDNKSKLLGNQIADKPVLTDEAGRLNVDRNPRYASPWENNIIDIDVSHQDEKTAKIRSFDLSKIAIARIDKSCFSSNRTLPLSLLPDFQNALKAGINATLHVKTDSIGDQISQFINNSSRLFSWLIHRGIYRLSQVNHQDTRELAELWPEHSWWGLLKYDVALKEVIDAAKNDSALAARLRGTGNVKKLTVNAFELSERIGLPIAANQVPLWFIDELADILKCDSDGQNRSPRAWEATESTYARLMVEINRFSFLPDGFDMIPFLPYPNSNADAAARFPNQGGRTKNISIADAVKIFAEALKWIYDYKPIIIEVANAARDALERLGHEGVKNELHVRNVSARAFNEAVARTGCSIPIKDFKHNDLRKLVNMLLTAAFCIIASNHGRRRNEVIGYNVPHGLYFGCLRSLGISDTDSRIDIYIAKSVRQYVTFWCNNLVRDAVHCLEELSQVFRPLNTPLKTYPSDQASGRDDKLFLHRTFTLHGYKAAPSQFDFGPASTWFFELAGVSTEYVNSRAHPFRRIFGLLYKYRYDRFKLDALSEHYVHVSYSMTEVYLTDASGVEPENSVEYLYSPALEVEMAKISAMHDEVDKEYLGDLIERLLNGELMGGVFPKLILALMKRLSADISFRTQNNAEKAATLQARLIKRGYAVSEKEHGACCCGNDSPTEGRSNCYKDGEIHPENASAEKCEGCLHLLTTPGYRKHLEVETAELAKQQEDYSLPLAVRLKAKQDLSVVKNYLTADERVAIETQFALNSIIDRWEPIFFSKLGK